ncbi:hypothetical protein [Flavisolibacter tropicus]|uniref:Uncharacterized protein n=1 Tax=Flavisolibacter tropicus TaxID=1492898 RepID=A0A172TX72_9BACT|nr:hypothetical protein [Flavisolibacter tropicus]ANE51568.1 hypothetical protein SY85_14705 [Flavisolibacter tropicus]
MAKQASIIELQGTIGNITFVKTQDGFRARKAARVSAATIASSAGFQRTRENMAEFGHAGTTGRVLRQAFSILLKNAKGKRVTSRLLKEMMKVVKADTVNPRGLRNVVDGELGFLQGFEFNNSADLKTTLAALYTTSINRATGLMTVNIPALVPTETIKAPEGATHYRVVCGGAEIDFKAETYTADFEESPYLPWTATTAAALSLTANVTPASELPLFLVMGLQFFQEVNGTYYALKTGEFNALSIVKVDA